jgi:hypothetical protein
MILKSHQNLLQKFELKRSLGARGPLSKLCVTPPFSVNLRCQIENQVSDYRLLGASSLFSIVSTAAPFVSVQYYCRTSF